MPLSPAELRRYQRHLLLPEVGPAGQAAFRQGRVLLVGAGGLGSPAAMYLAAAGVGTLGLIDHDTVDESNLQRQLLYGAADIGRPKLAAAADRLTDLNPFVRVVSHECWLDRHNALEIVAGYDLVLNGCDNFPTRYLINDACHFAGKPCVDGSIYRFEGQVTVYDTAAGGPCYRCRFPEPPPAGSVPSCAEAGVLGVLPGLIGCWQAAETLKWLLARAGVVEVELLVGRLLVVDVLAAEALTFTYARDPACPLCGDRPTLTELIDYDAFCGGAPPATAADLELDAPTLAARLAGPERPLLIDVREPWEWELCRLEGAVLIPLGELDRRLAELPRDRPLVTYCHGGVRSLKALQSLREHGFERVLSLAGGIDAWSRLVDPTVPRY